MHVPTAARTVIALAGFFLSPAASEAQWNGHAGDPQHTAISDTATLSLNGIRWHTTVDENNPTEPILIHYGSPIVTEANTVLVMVRGTSGYYVDARRGSDGEQMWKADTDFLNAPSASGWVPSFSATLTPAGQLYYQGIGGSVYRVADPNGASVAPVQMSFLPDYAANKAAYDSTVFISTPLTSDAAGNIYFGYEVKGSAPGGLTSGVAKIAASGSATYTSANVASGVAGANDLRVGTNSAPALSHDGSTLYLALNGSTDYLTAVNADTLAPQAHVTLSGIVHDAGTSSPTVGPDGDVFLGLLFGYHFRGTLQHFSADLSQTFTPGSFGWDITPSIVPASMVPSYSGTSSYLLFTKYNDYKERGGTGVNKIAILDPEATQFDPLFGPSGGLVMKEVLTIAGETPDSTLPQVREWCINTAAVDPFTHSILANSEDGKLYRWDLVTNTFSEKIELQAVGVLEAYTPTAIGPDGTVYAINKGVLFAVGIPEPGSAVLAGIGLFALAGWLFRRVKPRANKRKRIGPPHRS